MFLLNSRIVYFLLSLNFICCNNNGESKAISNIKITSYLTRVHHINNSNVKRFYLILYLDDCKICNTNREQMALSIISNPKVTAIVDNCTNPAAELYLSNSNTVLCDKNSNLSRYGLVFEKSIFFHIEGSQIIDTLSLTPQNLSRIKNLLTSSTE